MTDSSWFLLIVETACDQFKLVQACCWNWLWLFQTGCYWLLKLAVTSSNWFLLILETAWTLPCWLLKVAVTCSNWFMLIVETGSNKIKPVLIGCAWQEKITVTCSNWFLLFVETSCDYLKLVLTVTISNCDYLKLVLTETSLWLAQTGSCSLLKLAVTSSNWLLLVVEICCDQFKLIVETGWNKVKPVVTE